MMAKVSHSNHIKSLAAPVWVSHSNPYIPSLYIKGPVQQLIDLMNQCFYRGPANCVRAQLDPLTAGPVKVSNLMSSV